MISKDLPDYAAREWGGFLAPVTQLSMSGQNGGTPLVRHEKLLYNFDAICDALFYQQKSKRPPSVDALDISPQVVRLVEFKSGFRPKISRENFDKEKGSCKALGDVCTDYWKLFSKLKASHDNELLNSIRAKAVESLLTLEKQVFPLCKDLPRHISVFYVVVIDVEPTDKIEDILGDLGTKKQLDNTSNSLVRIKQSLSRLVGIQDAAQNIYCYDTVEVLSSQEYTERLSRDT